jgi:hypothetical protein
MEVDVGPQEVLDPDQLACRGREDQELIRWSSVGKAGRGYTETPQRLPSDRFSTTKPRLTTADSETLRLIGSKVGGRSSGVRNLKPRPPSRCRPTLLPQRCSFGWSD